MIRTQETTSQHRNSVILYLGESLCRSYGGKAIEPCHVPSIDTTLSGRLSRVGLAGTSLGPTPPDVESAFRTVSNRAVSAPVESGLAQIRVSDAESGSEMRNQGQIQGKG